MTDKLQSLREILEKRRLSALIIRNQCNLSWLLKGRSFIGLASEKGCFQLIVTPAKVYLCTNNIERPRLMAEELASRAGELDVLESNWWEPVSPEAFASRLGCIPAADDDALAEDFFQLRTVLTAGEQEDYAALCAASAHILEDACRTVAPGLSEFQVCGQVSQALWAQGIEPITLMAAFDGRTRLARHPIPTGNRLQNYALLVLCARRNGLVASVSRAVHLGPVPAGLLARHQACANVDAAAFSAVRTGGTSGDVFAALQRAYGQNGYEEEWRRHHQGGLTGYAAREYRAGPGTKDVMRPGQAFAFNPSIDGTKCEDTMLLSPDGPRYLSHTGAYAYVTGCFEGVQVQRPAILTL
ncbi:MAG: M24 family metallopeptidase [Candidatus Limiplasma sp.]|nr:M24 family metallopeptidase [Candidatus Limiplasma sp.]